MSDSNEYLTLKVEAGPTLDRRTFLTAGAVGAAAGSVAGLASAGSRLADTPLTGLDRTVQPNHDDPRAMFHLRARAAFSATKDRINERKQLQTAATVSALKTKYENPIFGRMRVWDLIERLAHCVDVTDTRLGGVSQLMHVQQALAAMEKDGASDPDLFLIALLHDLGKVFLLTDEVPENVLCRSQRLEEYPHEVGLDNVIYQFGHGELIYSRIKDHVPEHVAWSARYHMVDLDDATPYMNDRDRLHAEKYLKAFRTYDRDFKSSHFVPSVDMEKYRALIEQYFPQPILF